MTHTVRHRDWDVENRLKELDLGIDLLRHVGETALRARENCSPLYPPTFPGTAAWAEAVLILRQLTLPKGFRHADPGNFSMTINDERRFYMVVATGDENCGYYTGRTPSTKTPKGLKTQQAVERQLSFLPDTAPPRVEKKSGIAGYLGFWLLLNFKEREVAIELSAPSDIHRNKIVAWHERNIVPGVRYDPEAVTIGRPADDGFAPDFDIPVQRIA